jgi:hypothetical protein
LPIAGQHCSQVVRASTACLPALYCQAVTRGRYALSRKGRGPHYFSDLKHAINGFEHRIGTRPRNGIFRLRQSTAYP